MKNEPQETIEKAGFKADIFRDESPESPREWDNLGTMVCWHKRHDLGDKNPFSTPEDFDEWRQEQKPVLCLPLYLYDHSGLSMSTRRDYPFDCPWDSGQVGWIYVEADKVLREYSAKKLTASILEKAHKVLLAEVEAYDQYLTGDIWGFNLETGDAVMPDDWSGGGCWGFYGIEQCRNEAKLELKMAIKMHKRAVRANENAWGLAVGSI